MKIGVGITTYQRFDRFKECFEHLLKHSRDINEIVIVDDCSVKDKEKYDAFFDTILLNNIRVLRNKENQGVGHSKNKILHHFYEKGFDYIFTLEDDVNVISPDIFKAYIDAVQKTGYHYWNFAEHGTMNRWFRTEVINGYRYKIYPNIVGAFSLHTRHLIDKLGYYDNNYFNAMEHVDYAYRASKEGLMPPFWEFNDIEHNTEMMQEQKNSINDSSIRPRKDWDANITKGLIIFKQKHGVNLLEIPKP